MHKCCLEGANNGTQFASVLECTWRERDRDRDRGMQRRTDGRTDRQTETDRDRESTKCIVMVHSPLMIDQPDTCIRKPRTILALENSLGQTQNVVHYAEDNFK